MVPVKSEAEHIVGLSLKPARRLPDRLHAGEGLTLTHRRLETQPLVAPQGIEGIDPLKSFLSIRIIDAADIGEKVEGECRLLSEEAADREDCLLLDHHSLLPPEGKGIDDSVRELFL